MICPYCLKDNIFGDLKYTVDGKLDCVFCGREIDKKKENK